MTNQSLIGNIVSFAEFQNLPNQNSTQILHKYYIQFPKIAKQMAFKEGFD
jgi:hypothetical protein